VFGQLTRCRGKTRLSSHIQTQPPCDGSDTSVINADYEQEVHNIGRKSEMIISSNESPEELYPYAAYFLTDEFCRKVFLTTTNLCTISRTRYDRELFNICLPSKTHSTSSHIPSPTAIIEIIRRPLISFVPKMGTSYRLTNSDY